ncbi:MAG: hypothetical protein ACXW3D_02820 [Caulobacteraceae bacterium]
MRHLTLTIAAALAALSATAASAQHVMPQVGPRIPSVPSTAKYSLDTPIATLAANIQTREVLEKYWPGVTRHEHYPMFKDKSLKEIAPYAPDRLTPEILHKIKAELAKIE